MEKNIFRFYKYNQPKQFTPIFKKRVYLLQVLMHNMQVDQQEHSSCINLILKTLPQIKTKKYIKYT